MTEAPTVVANLCRERYAAGLEELMVCTPRRRDVLATLANICGCRLANEPAEPLLVSSDLSDTRT
jgi:hypothetical protein